MQNSVAVDEVKSSDRHQHPALDIGGHEDERLVPDDVLEIGGQELEDEVQVALVGEDGQHLIARGVRVKRSAWSVKQGLARCRASVPQ